MFKYEKIILIEEEKLFFKYNIFLSELVVCVGDEQVLTKFLWLPFEKVKFIVNDVNYQIDILLFPINKMTLIRKDSVICCELFPKLKRYSIVMFCLSSSKKIALMLALVFS